MEDGNISTTWCGENGRKLRVITNSPLFEGTYFQPTYRSFSFHSSYFTQLTNRKVRITTNFFDHQIFFLTPQPKNSRSAVQAWCCFGSLAPKETPGDSERGNHPFSGCSRWFFLGYPLGPENLKNIHTHTPDE